MNSLNEEQKQKYQKYIKEVTPTHSLPLEMGKAFLTGDSSVYWDSFLSTPVCPWGLKRRLPEPGVPFFSFS